MTALMLPWHMMPNLRSKPKQWPPNQMKNKTYKRVGSLIPNKWVIVVVAKLENK